MLSIDSLGGGGQGVALVSIPPVVKSCLQPTRGYRKSIYKDFRASHLVGSGGLEAVLA